MAARQRVPTMVAFRITHREKVCGVDTDIQLEANLPCCKLISELCIEVLKLATSRLVSDAQLGTNSLEHSAELFPRRIGFRCQPVNSISKETWLVEARIGEELHRRFEVGVAVVVVASPRSCKSITQNVDCQIANALVIRIVRPRSVDDERVNVLAPDRRLAEQLPKLLLGVAAIPCEAGNECV